MCSLSVFTNCNIERNKAVAPNNGAAALFYSTDFWLYATLCSRPSACIFVVIMQTQSEYFDSIL